MRGIARGNGERQALSRANPWSNPNVRGYALLFVGTALLLVYLFGLDLEELAARAEAFPVKLALLILGLNVFPGLIKTLRWRQLLRFSGVESTRGGDYLAVNSSFFLGLVTPGTTGEFSRALSLKKDSRKGFAILTFEKATDLLVLFVLAVAAATYELAAGPAAYVLPAALLVALAIAYVFYVRFDRYFTHPAKLVVEKLLKTERAETARLSYWEFFGLLRNGKLLLASSAFSVLLWLVPLLQIKLIYSGLGIALPLTTVAATYFLPYLMGILSMIPLGLGTFDLSLSEITALYPGIQFASLGVVPVFYRLVVTVPLIIFGYLCQVALTLCNRPQPDL